MAEHLSLSYAELGRRLGISPDGARMYAKRKKLTRIVGNDGRAVVLVDPKGLPERSPSSPPNARAVSPVERPAAIDVEAPEWPPNVRAEQAERLVLLRHLEDERAERAKLVDLLAAERAQRDAMLTQLTAVLAERTKLVGLFGQLLEAIGREKDGWRQELERHRAAADARLDEAKVALEEEKAERQHERAEWREAARRWQAEAESRLAESVRKAERLEAKLGEALLAHRQALADQERRHRAERAAWVAERRGLQAKLDDRVERMPRRRGWLARLRGR